MSSGSLHQDWTFCIIIQYSTYIPYPDLGVNCSLALMDRSHRFEGFLPTGKNCGAFLSPWLWRATAIPRQSQSQSHLEDNDSGGRTDDYRIGLVRVVLIINHVDGRKYEGKGWRQRANAAVAIFV